MMHIMKVILLLGLCYGLRGGQEIAELEVNNIKIGIFPNDHPLSGKKFLEVNPMNTKDIPKEHLIKKINNIIKEGYEFMGYVKLANRIK